MATPRKKTATKRKPAKKRTVKKAAPKRKPARKSVAKRTTKKAKEYRVIATIFGNRITTGNGVFKNRADAQKYASATNKQYKGARARVVLN